MFEGPKSISLLKEEEKQRPHQFFFNMYEIFKIKLFFESLRHEEEKDIHIYENPKGITFTKGPYKGHGRFLLQEQCYKLARKKIGKIPQNYYFLGYF